MSKKLILGLALAIVLVSGPLFSAQAGCGFGCLPHISLPSCCSGTCGQVVEKRDADKPAAPCQGMCYNGPTVPDQFGSAF